MIPWADVWAIAASVMRQQETKHEYSDAIEAIGVPHPEIMAIVVNQAAVDFRYNEDTHSPEGKGRLSATHPVAREPGAAPKRACSTDTREPDSSTHVAATLTEAAGERLPWRPGSAGPNGMSETTSGQG